jgi:hypothetical protein
VDRLRSKLAALAAVAALAAGAVPVLDAVVAQPADSATTVDVHPRPGSYFDLVRGVDLVSTAAGITYFNAYCRVNGQVFGSFRIRSPLPVANGHFAYDGALTLLYVYFQRQIHVRIDGQMAGSAATGSISTPADSSLRCDPVSFAAAYVGPGLHP